MLFLRKKTFPCENLKHVLYHSFENFDLKSFHDESKKLFLQPFFEIVSTKTWNVLKPVKTGRSS